MPTLTYEYVYLTRGPHQRQPTRTGSANGFTLIESISGGAPAPGGTFAASSQPPTQIIGTGTDQQTYLFSFMTVSGGSLAAGGPAVGVTSFGSNNPPAPVLVGEAPITVLVVYVPPGGPGSGSGSGATIDAFDETAGVLFNDTFVTVEPDATGALSKSGNVEGYVDTTNGTEAITAVSPTSPTGVHFSRWVNLGPPATQQASPVLMVNKGVSIMALAFYEAPAVGTLTGKVSFDSDGGMGPLGGATIYAQGTGSTTSGPDGTYTLAVKPGVTQVTVSHNLYTTDHDTFTVVVGQTITTDFVLVRKGTTF